jgi:glycosyltransferase involved in cell wall biosynthesis
MPQISIIIPTFDRPAQLFRALASVASQTVQDFDVTIVNDGGGWPESFSPPACGAAVKAIMRPHGGPAAARNSGLAASDSKYIAYLDDDDEWGPDHLESLLSVLKQRPEVAMTFAVADVVDKGHHIRRWGDCRFDKFILDSFYTIFPLSTCMHRRDILTRVGCFDEHPFLVGPEDCEFIIRASDHSTPVPNGRCTVTMHREQSMTREPRNQWVDVLDYVIRKLGYGATRSNWLMFYRAWVAALKEGRPDLAEQWSEYLDRQLPSTLKRSGMAIVGEYRLLPDGIKEFCRHAIAA